MNNPSPVLDKITTIRSSVTAPPRVDPSNAGERTDVFAAVAPSRYGPPRQPVRQPPLWQDPFAHRIAFFAAVLGIAAVTAALRLFHQTISYELFIDEIQYAYVSNSIAAGHGPTLFGDPFFLHPTLFFAYLSSFIGQPVPYLTPQFVLSLRPLVIPFAVANCVLVIAIARRITSRRCALVAGALYSLDPFIVRFDSRVMLEAPTLTATLAGLAAALVAVQSQGRRRTTMVVLAGLAFGIAVTTKSTSALVTTLPLLLILAVSGGPRRRETITMIAIQCGVYGIYVAWVIETGHFGDWFAQTLHGVVRAAAKPQTGFNSISSPTFGDRIVAQATQFGPSYLLIAVAGGAIAVLVFEEIRSRGRVGRHSIRDAEPHIRMLTCWLGGVILAIGYTAAFGELEEQTFYLMAVPATVVIAVLAARTHSRIGRAALWSAVAAVLLWSGQVWFTVHTEPDDAYLKLAAYLQPLAGSGDPIAMGEKTAQFVSPGFVIVALDGTATPPGAKFALVSTELSRLNLSTSTTEDIAKLNRRYPVVFVAGGRTVGELRLYDLTRPLDPAAAQAGRTTPG